jgi:hypothetical protein
MALFAQREGRCDPSLELDRAVVRVGAGTALAEVRTLMRMERATPGA